LISCEEDIGGGHYLQCWRGWRIDRERRCPRLGTLASVGIGKGDGEWPVGAGCKTARVSVHRKRHGAWGRKRSTRYRSSRPAIRREGGGYREAPAGTLRPARSGDAARRCARGRGKIHGTKFPIFSHARICRLSVPSYFSLIYLAFSSTVSALGTIWE